MQFLPLSLSPLPHSLPLSIPPSLCLPHQLYLCSVLPTSLLPSPLRVFLIWLRSPPHIWMYTPVTHLVPPHHTSPFTPQPTCCMSSYRKRKEKSNHEIAVAEPPSSWPAQLSEHSRFHVDMRLCSMTLCGCRMLACNR